MANAELLVHERSGSNCIALNFGSVVSHFVCGLCCVCKGLVFVVDSTDTDQLEDAKARLDKSLGLEGNAGKCLLVFANKQDCPGAMAPDLLAEKLELNKLDRAWKIQACCAPSGEGLADGLEWLIHRIK
eukprot:c2347_g1_i2.p1 GENE.c2347_g1_i2~~c2347_g1_i2.p1  ORF type:complete len:129 (+),score=20.87 c2347_g1_i2:275-661(+)